MHRAVVPLITPPVLSPHSSQRNQHIANLAPSPWVLSPAHQINLYLLIRQSVFFDIIVFNECISICNVQTSTFRADNISVVDLLCSSLVCPILTQLVWSMMSPFGKSVNEIVAPRTRRRFYIYYFSRISPGCWFVITPIFVYFFESFKLNG